MADVKILVHVCCGPCAVYPLQALRTKGYEVEGYFFNPNIHPFQEFQRRINALKELTAIENFPVDFDDTYGLQEYLRQVVFNEKERCSICYDMRLARVARKAEEKGFDAFTSTLLYSTYQNHGQIKKKGEQLALDNGVEFYYEDFRSGWQEGIDRSKEMGLYRQPYCGCIYSEQERYDPKMRKRK